jgi:hypothetical protein
MKTFCQLDVNVASVNGCFLKRTLIRKVEDCIYLQCGPDRDHQFEPGGKQADGFAEEGDNGVSVVRLVELCFI